MQINKQWKPSINSYNSKCLFKKLKWYSADIESTLFESGLSKIESNR